ncbi:MAG: N-acetyl-gamma-glutamyl-phosphate reductase [Clostridia bacterium]|jgi:N-acetyl-gamma-glutamyl-phosphate reductase|nr:N-acetyl-gamma-glutamyl-phosphate reductase [Clostridia bacterium]
MIKVFIDGKAGTTGLRIFERLQKRDDVKIVSLSENLRKDPAARKEAINGADVVFLCLPDDAAREAVTLAENPHTVVIDASTAHRTQAGWAYGFPELSPRFRAAVQSGKRIANPGCYASGFLALVYPLVQGGILPPDYPLVCHAVSGYSGAGKKGIEQYKSENRDRSLQTPRLYALGLTHKHLPEMTKISGLTRTPVFNPYICDYECGMSVTVPLFADLLSRSVTKEDLTEFYREWYKGERFVGVGREESGFLCANALNGTNRLEIFVNGNEERILLVSRLDNLGKGASGAAIQNMNLALGLDEGLGL